MLQAPLMALEKEPQCGQGQEPEQEPEQAQGPALEKEQATEQVQALVQK
jgi:hypothetical protein